MPPSTKYVFRTDFIDKPIWLSSSQSSSVNFANGDKACLMQHSRYCVVVQKHVLSQKTLHPATNVRGPGFRALMDAKQPMP